MLFVKLMLIIHSVKRTNNRSSVAKHPSVLFPPKQIFSTNDRRRNTGTTVDSSVSPVTNMLLAGSLTKRCNGLDLSRARKSALSFDNADPLEPNSLTSVVSVARLLAVSSSATLTMVAKSCHPSFGRIYPHNALSMNFW